MLLGICTDPPPPAAGGRMPNAAPLWERWPALAAVPPALAWLSMRADLGLARTAPPDPGGDQQERAVQQVRPVGRLRRERAGERGRAGEQRKLIKYNHLAAN